MFVPIPTMFYFDNGEEAIYQDYRQPPPRGRMSFARQENILKQHAVLTPSGRMEIWKARMIRERSERSSLDPQ